MTAPAIDTANVTWIRGQLNERVGNPYVYGGVLSPSNPRQGCDCSALAAHALNGVLFGPAMTWQRTDPTRAGAWITTESWRPVEVGQRGPFGTITVARPADIPADAVCKVALHHGPGGGANSHMWIELAGVRYESAGGKGLVRGNNARAITDPYGNDWAYLPGSAPAAPAVPILKPGSSGDRVRILQHGLRANFMAYSGSVAVTGVMDEATVAAVREFQRRTHLTVDGKVGDETTAKLRQFGIDLAGPVPALRLPTDLTDRQLLEEIWRQLRGPTGAGWPQLGNRSAVDAIGHLIEMAGPF